MDTGILHTHTLIVSLFLVLQVVTLVWVAMNASKKDVSSPKWLKLSHMILGSLMLLTGLFLMFRSPSGMEPYVLLKLGLVLIATPLGIIGSRKKSIALTAVATLLVMGTYYLGWSKPEALRSVPTDLVEVTAGNAVVEGGQSDEVSTDQAIKIGKSLYFKRNCNSCHGTDGAAGFQKAKNLQLSTMSDKEMAEIIVNGKGLMPANEGLNDSEVDYLVNYIKTFKK